MGGNKKKSRKDKKSSKEDSFGRPFSKSQKAQGKNLIYIILAMIVIGGVATILLV